MPGMRWCQDCTCQLHPECSRPRWQGPWCHKHKTQLDNVPEELMVQYRLREVLPDMVPGDIEVFLDVCRASTHENTFLELVFAMVKEPTAIRTMQRLMSAHLKLEGDVFMLDAQSVTSWWRAAVTAVDGVACEADHDNLGRQGAAKHLGFLRTSQKFGILTSSQVSHSPPSITSPATRPSLCKRPAAASARGTKLSARKRPAAAPAGGTPRRRRQSPDASDAGPGVSPGVVRLGAKLAPQCLTESAEMSVIAKALQVCASAALPAVRNEMDVLVHALAYLEMLRRLPSVLGMGGDCISMHLVRKRLLVTVSRLTAPPSWACVTVGELQELGPDRGSFLRAIPPGWSVRAAGLAFGVDPLLLGMFACLFHEALKLPGALECCRRRGVSQLLMQIRNQYRAVHGINPCPAILLHRALAAYRGIPRCDE